jgi:hypothetical protein
MLVAQSKTKQPGAANGLAQRATDSVNATDTAKMLQRTPAYTAGHGAVPLLGGVAQTKMAIGAADDPYEREADSVADRVTDQAPRTQDQTAPAIVRPNGLPQISRLQRKCAKCEEEEIQRQPMKEKEREKETLRAKDVPGTALEVTPSAEAQINSLRGGGEPLSEPLRAYFEPRFGWDFSAVRLHTDSQAARAATEISARAFTHGEHIFFGPGQYRPDTTDGRQVLAHELTHTIQQGAIHSGNSLGSLHPVLAAPTVQRKPLKKPYRAQIVAAKDTPVETCQNVNAEGCRTDVLSPGMEVIITEEFVGGVWLFAQNLPEQAVKALYGQKWIYIPAKYVERLPEAQGKSSPSQKQKSDTDLVSAGRVDQLSDAIYGSDKEKVIALLNEGGLEAALEMLRRVQENAEAKGRVSPMGYLGDDFGLDVSNESELRVAVVAHTIKLSRRDWSGSLDDAYDALISAAKRLGGFAPGIVTVYLDAQGGTEIKAVVEQRRTQEVGELVEQYERMKAAEKDPLGVFKQRLKDKTLKVLDQNETAVQKQLKALSAEGSSDEAWKRLETVVVPQAIRYAQLGDLEEKLTSLVTHTAKALSYAEAGNDDQAAIEYAEERGEPPEGAWWRPNRFPLGGGGGGASTPAPIEEIQEELEQAQKQLASVREQRADLKERFPLVKALRPALIEKLAKGPPSCDAAAVAEFRSNAFFDLKNQVFEAALSAIKTLRADVEADNARLYSFKPLVDEVKSELMLGADQEAKIDAWVKQQKGRDETIRVVTSGLSIALLPFMFVPGGQLVAAIVGVLSAAYGAEVAGEQYVAAKAGMAGKEITEKSVQETRWEANLALLDLLLSGWDLASALKAVSQSRRAAKGASAVEELAEESSPKSRRSGVGAPRPGRRIPGLPGCAAGTVHCLVDYLHEVFPDLLDRRATADFAEYLHPSVYEVEELVWQRQSLRKDMYILKGEGIYRQYLREVPEREWSEPFSRAVAHARTPGVDHRIIYVSGKPMKWPLDDLGASWVVHHDPPLNWSASEGAHLWHPMPYRVHDAAHAWWRDLERRIRARVRQAGADLDDALDLREL